MTNALRVARVDKIGAVYVLAGIVILFSILSPDTFPTWTTAKSIFNENATTAVIALSIVVPLTTRVFDLSIGNTVALMTVGVAWLVVQHGTSVGVALAAALAFSLVVGAVNALVVVRIGIDSFIATLGTGAVIQALVLLISGEMVMTSPEMSSTLVNISSTDIVGGIQLPVFVALGVAVAIWWLLEHTVTGRRLYAVGFNDEAARLAGVRVKRLRTMGLLVSGFVAGIAGLLVVMQLGAGSPTAGPSYLLSAFSAAFLGATQIRNGRFNAWGTIIAVLVLGTGVSGLTQVGGAPWTIELYTGAVLIIALAVTKLELGQARRTTTDRPDSPGTAQGAAGPSNRGVGPMPTAISDQEERA
jgi:ribose/xylose/arabinose/galactoside ABC-type transport system permease subunit